MRGKYFFLVILLACLFLDVDAEKVKIKKKVKKQRVTTTEQPQETRSPEEEMAKLVQMERQHEKDFHRSQVNRVKNMENVPLNNENELQNEVFVDVCSKVHCSAGRVCELDKEGEPQCVCIAECPVEVDERRMVCSNHNETWSSDCEVHRQRCLCLSGDETCKGPQYSHVQIEYYGICRQMPECSSDEMADFPRRMRDWLFNIMLDLAEREELSPHYMKMQKEAETNHTRRWINAAIWKWCDLDAADNDRFVSRHELFPIRAPLLALEHCIGPFLNNCDYDNDHRITLSEWGKCLELDDNELDEKCDDLNEDF